MPSLITCLAIAVSSSSLVLGHGHIHQVVANGKTYPGYTPGAGTGPNDVGWSTSVEDNGPVSVKSLQNPDIICHLDGKNAPASVEVNAGDTIQILYIGGIGGFPHPGVNVNYMASCEGDCATVDKSSLKFFKVSEAGLTAGGPNDAPDYLTQRWITTDVHHKTARGSGTETIDTYEVTIPAAIKPGPYVLRHELIALHMAHEGNSEFYPGCVNLEVRGSGTDLPDGIPATELYKSSDESLNIDIYTDVESYDIPGPPVASFKESDSQDENDGDTAPATSTMEAAPTSTAHGRGGSKGGSDEEEEDDDDDDDDEKVCHSHKSQSYKKRTRRHRA